MLGLKSFHTAAVTFSGIELAHRIRKRQFTLALQRNGRALSLKDLWDQALSGKSFSDSLEDSPPPLMHEISPVHPCRAKLSGAARTRPSRSSPARTILYDPRWPWHAAAHLGRVSALPSSICAPRPANSAPSSSSSAVRKPDPNAL